MVGHICAWNMLYLIIIWIQILGICRKSAVISCQPCVYHPCHWVPDKISLVMIIQELNYAKCIVLCISVKLQNTFYMFYNLLSLTIGHIYAWFVKANLLSWLLQEVIKNVHTYIIKQLYINVQLYIHTYIYTYLQKAYIQSDI